MRTQRLLSVRLALVFIATFGGVVAAHHSRAGLDPNDKPILQKGTVAEYRWKNPHVLLFWDVKDDSGNVVRWNGEFGSVLSSIASGLNKNTYKVGEEIIVTAIPSRAGTPVALIRKIARTDGTAVVYAD